MDPLPTHGWRRFAPALDERRLADAQRSLQEALARPRLDGVRFLDVGCSSGLFSLAALHLGATVRSIDDDEGSVDFTRALLHRYAPAHSRYRVSTGDILDGAFMDGLGTFDVVYAWGVLYRAGAMWRALAHAAARVAPGGQLVLSLYRGRGALSRVRAAARRSYDRLPTPWVPALAGTDGGRRELAHAAYWASTFRPSRLLRAWTGPPRRDERWRSFLERTLAVPFRPPDRDEVLSFLNKRDLHLKWVRSLGDRQGYDELVLVRPDAPPG